MRFTMWYWRIYEQYDWPDWFIDFMGRLAPHLLCIFGHDIVDDQCGLPEHRYCWKCQSPAPFEPTELPFQRGIRFQAGGE